MYEIKLTSFLLMLDSKYMLRGQMHIGGFSCPATTYYRNVLTLQRTLILKNQGMFPFIWWLLSLGG